MSYCSRPDPPTTIEQQQLPTTTSTTTTATLITDTDLPYNAIILKSHSSTFPKGITNEYRHYRKSVPRRKIPIHELEEQFYIPFMKLYPNHFVINDQLSSMMEQLSNIFYEEIMIHNTTVERMYRPLNDTERDEYVQLDIMNNGKKKPKNNNKTKTTLSESYTIYDIIQQTRIDLQQSLSNHILKPTYELMLHDIETRILNNNSNSNILQMNETTTTIMNHEEIVSIIRTIYTTFFHRPISISTTTQVKKRKRCNNHYNIDNDNSTTTENCIHPSLFSSSHHSTAGSSMNNNADDDDSFMDIMNVSDFGNELLIHDNDGNVNNGINNQDPPSTGEEEERTLNDNNSSYCNVPIQSLNDDTTCSNSDNDDYSALIMNDDNNCRNIMRTTLHRTTTTIDKTYETSIEFESVQSVIDCTTNEAISFSIGVATTTSDTDSDSDYETNNITNNNDANDEMTPIGVQNSLSSHQYQQQQQDRYGSCIGTSLGISGCNDDNHDDDDDDDDKYYHQRSQQLQFRRSNRSLFKRFGSRWDVDSIDMNNTNNITGTRRTINTNNNNNNTNTTLNDFKISRIVRWFYHRIIK